MNTNILGIPENNVPLGYGNYSSIPLPFDDRLQDETRRRWNPMDDIPSTSNPWPRISQPFRASEVDPSLFRVLYAYRGGEEIPERLQALLTTPTPPWMLEYKQRRDELLGPLSQKARTLLDFARDNISRPAGALTVGARTGADAFSKYAAQMENTGTPVWQAVPSAIVQSLPDFGRGAARGFASPGAFPSPGQQAVQSIDRPWLREMIGRYIDTVATPGFL